MAVSNVPPRRGAGQVAALLDSPEIGELIADLQETRWTGRRGYPLRAMVDLALVKSVYALPTWSRTVRLVGEHVALQEVLGVAPSIDSTYRFTRKLRQHSGILAACLDRVIAGLREVIPGLGENLAIDGSDLPAWANGMRDLPNGKPRTHYADPDASWGHRSAISTRKGGGYYGYKVHAAVCTKTDLPLAWHVASACDSEHEHMASLLDTVIGHGFTPGTCALDKGYDGSGIYAACESRDIRPVIPLKQTVNVVNGLHKPPSCPHGVWTFAGSDTKRGASKWRCPTRKCQPASVWVKADRLHTLIPRTTDRWKAIYRTRVSVEREFGGLKHEWGMLPLRVRRLPRVALHVDLTILARLTSRLLKARAQALPLAA